MTQQKTFGPRERLLDVAGRLFYAEGIHAVGVDRVISEANVAKATLYAHFSGKEELVAAYLARRSEEWQIWIDASLPARAETPLDQILALFDLLSERFQSPDYRGCPFINAAAEYPGPGVVTDQITNHRERVRLVFRSLLDRAGSGATEQLVEALVVLYDGAMVGAQLDGRPASAHSARLAADSLLDAKSR